MNFNLDFSNSWVDYSIPTLSISDLLGMLVEPFDKEGVAQKTFENHFNNPNSEYYQMTVEQIIEKWTAKGAASCHYGSLLDNYIGYILNEQKEELESFKYNNNYAGDDRLHGLCNSFDDFYSVLLKSGDTIFVDRERTLYYEIEIPNPENETEIIRYYIKGRFDALFYNKRTNKWIIIDWKSSGNIDKVPNKYTKKLLGPMSKYPALNYYTYTTQLYFYKKALIKKYLPQGTSVDDVIVMIVNLPGKIIEECNRDFMVYQAAYPYDTILLDKLFEFGVKNNYMEKRLKAKENNVKEQEKLINDIF